MLINFTCISYIVSLHKINVEIHCLHEVIFFYEIEIGVRALRGGAWYLDRYDIYTKPFEFRLVYGLCKCSGRIMSDEM
jgi:hypothetical protein